MVPSFEFEYDDDQRRLRNTSPPNTNTRMDGGQIQVWCPKYRYAKAQIQGRKCCSLFIDRYPKYRSVFAYYMSAPHLKLPYTVPHQINELSE